MKTLTDILESLEMQRVFVVLKPGSLDLGQTVIEIFAKKGWNIYQTRTKHLLLSEAKKLYAVHKKESFYEDLCNYMSSAPCRAFIFEKPGKTTKKSFEEVAKIKDSIRKKYGESDMRNVLHSSDSQEAMDNEAPLFFVY